MDNKKEVDIPGKRFCKSNRKLRRSYILLLTALILGTTVAYAATAETVTTVWQIDSAAPVKDGEPIVATSWTQSNNARVKFKDQTLESLEYCVDGGNWTVVPEGNKTQKSSINWTATTAQDKLSSGYVDIPFTTSGTKVVKIRDKWQTASVDEQGGTSNHTLTVNVIQTKVDSTKPTVPIITTNTPDYISGGKDWFKNDVTVTILDGTDTQSGVKETLYKVDKGSWTKYTAPFTVDRTSVVYAKTIDTVALESDEVTHSIFVDKIKPADPTYELSSKGDWVNIDDILTIAGGEDTSSGWKKYMFKVDDGVWLDYSNRVTIPTSGDKVKITKVYIKAVDNVGNESNVLEVISKYDGTLPIKPTLIKDPTIEWSDVNVTVTITYPTKTGAASPTTKKEYSLDRKIWVNYIEPIVITKTEIVYARQIDTAGNISEVGTINVNIDRAIPTAPIIAKDPTNEWHHDDIEVSITDGIDENFLRTEYKLGKSGEWKTYSVPFTLKTTEVVYSRTLDKAGNISEESKIGVNIDRTPVTVVKEQLKDINKVKLKVSGPVWGRVVKLCGLDGTVVETSTIYPCEFIVNINKGYKIIVTD